jgi:hypothetical protein
VFAGIDTHKDTLAPRSSMPPGGCWSAASFPTARTVSGSSFGCPTPIRWCGWASRDGRRSRCASRSNRHPLRNTRQTHHGTVQHAQQPQWVAGMRPPTLVVIDEAGMADTLSPDAAVSYIVEQGGSVRLVGDDQQLAAIGAGAVPATSRAHMGRSDLPSCCGSPIRSKPPPPSLYATAKPRRSRFTSTTGGCTSATYPP